MLSQVQNEVRFKFEHLSQVMLQYHFGEVAMEGNRQGKFSLKTKRRTIFSTDHRIYSILRGYKCQFLLSRTREQ